MKDAKSISILLGLFVFIAFVLSNLVGRVSAYFFTSIDSFLLISNSIPPIIMWMVLGLLLGLIFGSLVAIKKYRLDYKLLIYPIAVVLLLLAVIYGLSRFTKKRGDNSDLSSNSAKAASSKRKSKIKGFDENLTKGIEAVEKEEYKDAEDFFKLANALDSKDSRLDSLAKVYLQIGEEKCKLYRHRKNLRYLPDYYFRYAAALQNTSPKICK
ncbi:hypothetical protein [Dyadobacter tibetensis]|uniref:hypothetical protein n=1 Tax=Dyadobacter tibetensis TaxID=1211851 RepID=UPI00046E6A46|nr:hypothetical protein [Dyadobacter tibetensis]